MNTFTFKGTARRALDAETVQTLRGKVYASPGDWIVTSSDGALVAIVRPEDFDRIFIAEEKPAPAKPKK